MSMNRPVSTPGSRPDRWGWGRGSGGPAVWRTGTGLGRLGLPTVTGLGWDPSAVALVGERAPPAVLYLSLGGDAPARPQFLAQKCATKSTTKMSNKLRNKMRNKMRIKCETHSPLLHLLWHPTNSFIKRYMKWNKEEIPPFFV